MGLVLSCREADKIFGEVSILNHISFDIAEGDKIGLVGRNGAGKTTLVNLIAGELKADSGNLYWHKRCVNLGYLKQESAYMEEMKDISGVSEINGIIENSDTENSNTEIIDIKISDTKDYLYAANTLGLKKVHEWDNAKLMNLSGGERTKLAISRIWAKRPDFLILDEPTNHLDYEGVNWLIKELGKYKGTVLIISHDRYFLDQCVNKIMELEDGRLLEYPGNYSFYRDEKQRRYESQLNQYYLQEKMKQRIDEQIKTLKNWSEKAHREAPAKAIAAGNKKGGKEFLRAKAKKMDIQVKSRIKRLEKIEIEGVQKPKEEDKIVFKLNSAVLKGNRIIEVSELTKTYQNKLLFQDSSFYVQKGEKVGLFGENGCGKTTLLKLLMGMEEPDQGTVFFSSSARPGYLSQDISQLDLNKKVTEFFDIAAKEEILRMRKLLSQMGFHDAMLHQTLSSLSLGELTRLRIAGLICKECDFLLLDEPLNHLDLNSREQLEEVLWDYNGTILLVSHDRYMLEKICDKLLVFEDGKIKRIEYGLQEYLDKKAVSKKSANKKNTINAMKEERLLIENELALVLSEFSRYTVGSEEYGKLDQRFQSLIKRKKEIEKYPL